MDIAPGRPDVFWRIDGIFVIGSIGEGNISVFPFPFFGIDVVPTINFCTHGLVELVQETCNKHCTSLSILSYQL